MLSEQVMLFLKSGRLATAGTNVTLTDTGVVWIVNALVGFPLKIIHYDLITGLTTEFDTFVISNTANQLTFAALAGGALVGAGDAYFFPLDNIAIAAILANLQGKPNVHDVVLYPVAILAGTTVISDDGSSPAYYPAVAASTTSNSAVAPGVAWSQLINFEQQGIINVISIFLYAEWQTKLTLGAGDATLTNSKLQISRDGGANWVDVTDVFSHANVVMTKQKRQSAGIWLATIVAGASQLGFRLVQWTNDSVGGAGRSSSEAQVRITTLSRITYRKS